MSVVLANNAGENFTLKRCSVRTPRHIVLRFAPFSLALSLEIKFLIGPLLSTHAVMKQGNHLSGVPGHLMTSYILLDIRLAIWEF